jgi:hypothetical protein
LLIPAPPDAQLGGTAPPSPPLLDPDPDPLPLEPELPLLLLDPELLPLLLDPELLPPPPPPEPEVPPLDVEPPPLEEPASVVASGAPASLRSVTGLFPMIPLHATPDATANAKNAAQPSRLSHMAVPQDNAEAQRSAPATIRRPTPTWGSRSYATGPDA